MSAPSTPPPSAANGFTDVGYSIELKPVDVTGERWKAERSPPPPSTDHAPVGTHTNCTCPICMPNKPRWNNPPQDECLHGDVFLGVCQGCGKEIESTPPPSADDRARAEYDRGWRQAMAEVAAAIPCDADTIYKNEHWYAKMLERIDSATKPLEAEIARLRELSAAAVLGKATAERAVARIMDQREALSRKVTLLESERAILTRERDEAREALCLVTPSHRSPGDCWCGHGHDIENYGHTLACKKAQAIVDAARKERG